MCWPKSLTECGPHLPHVVQHWPMLAEIAPDLGFRGNFGATLVLAGIASGNLSEWATFWQAPGNMMICLNRSLHGRHHRKTRSPCAESVRSPRHTMEVFPTPHLPGDGRALRPIGTAPTGTSPAARRVPRRSEQMKTTSLQHEFQAWHFGEQRSRRRGVTRQTPLCCSWTSSANTTVDFPDVPIRKH